MQSENHQCGIRWYFLRSSVVLYDIATHALTEGFRVMKLPFLDVLVRITLNFS